MKILKNISWRPLVVKIIGYSLAIYLSLVLISVIVTGVIFFNLDNFKHKIIQVVDNKSGGNLTIGRLQTKLNSYYLPELLVDNLQFKPFESSSKELYIKQIDLVVDYSSLWRFRPIFNEIMINGVALDLVLESSGAYYLNGIQVSDADDGKLKDVKSFDFDIQDFLLQQKSINIDNVSFSVEDKRNRIPKIQFEDIQFEMTNQIFSHHRAELNIYGNLHKNNLKTKLSWVGGNFNQIDKWDTANLDVYTNFNDNESNLKDNNLQSVATASLSDGRLQEINLDFDANNFKLALGQLDIINLPDFDGQLLVKLQDKNNYTITARNLKASSSSGVLFANSQIDGKYEIDKSGYFNLTNTNLLALNNILTVFPNTRGLQLSGTISSVGYKWTGSFQAPKSYEVDTQFKDISLASKNPSVPSINNVTGEIKFNTKGGNVKLNLQDSKLLYDQVFFIPYEFNLADIDANWTVSESGLVLVNLAQARLKMKDFNGVAKGHYTYDPSNVENPSFIDLTAHVDTLAINRVDWYLPKAIPMSVHNWLRMGLVSGNAESADLVLRGALGSFPFEDNSGLFYITANVKDATLVYAKGWEKLEHINGKFILKNTNITVLSDDVSVGNNHAEKVKVVIPDFAAESIYLTANAEAYGSTTKFMQYLTKTPVNHLIGDLPEKIKASGNGKLSLYLNVPFNNPHKTIVNGDYDFINNNLDLGIPAVPQLSNVNGKLNFRQYGVNIDSITASALNSTAHLSAKTRESDLNHEMKFSVNIPELDYKEVAYEYLPFFAPIIDGKSNSTVDFIIGKGGLKELVASSDLNGVAINAPEPLTLQIEERKKLMVKVTPETPQPHSGMEINWRYGNDAHGVQYIGNNLATGKIAVGSAEYMQHPDKHSLMTVQANLESINIIQWVAVVSKIVTENTEREKQKSLLDKNKLLSTKKYAFPLQITIASDNILLGKLDSGAGTINVLVTKDDTSFNLFSPLASGYGNFDYTQKIVNLNLDNYMINKKLSEKGGLVVDYVPLNFVNGSNESMEIHLPDMKLQIRNLFLQNHNLGQVSANVYQRGQNLHLESGILFSPDYRINFSATNYCFGCSSKHSYVNFIADADIQNAGNLVYNLDLGQQLSGGQGNAKAQLQWNGGFQDFKVFGNIGEIKANIVSGNLVNVKTGFAGALFSFLDLQGIYKLFEDPNALFRDGFFFDKLNLDMSLLTSRLDINKLDIYGPLATIKSNGVVDLKRENVDLNLAVTPHIGFAVAVAAGVATLNPLIGLAVYGVELLSGDVQNKLASVVYDITGTLNKPIVTKTDIQENIVHNIHSTINME